MKKQFSQIKWMVQDVGINYQNLSLNFEALQRLGYDYSNFGVIADKKLITNLENILTPEAHYIIRGGTKMLTLLENVDNIKILCPELSSEQSQASEHYIERLRAGIFYDIERFDQAYYCQLSLPLLNSDAKLYSVKESLMNTFSEDVFVKPTRDLKAFNAGVMPAFMSLDSYIKSSAYQAFYIDEQVLVAPVKEITAEYRFFVVNEQVITGSQYRFAGRNSLSAVVPDNILAAAQEYAKLYAPHDVFTMDLAQTQKGIFIVEYNCWNASGLYLTDVPKIFHAVQHYKEDLCQTKRMNLKNSL